VQLRQRLRTICQCRRRTAAALALAGVGLVLGAAATASVGQSRSTYLERHPQTERVLPVPDASAASAALAAARPAAPAIARKSGTSHRQISQQMPHPVRVVIPAIGLSAPLIPLGLNSDGTAEVPKSFSVAGWFRPGPEPGERGAAVILGHVDSRRGPGVFYHLPALRRGDRITVVLVNRKTLQFVVTGSTRVSKNHFPTKLVYARTAAPTLRLVTCGGSFNSATGHYVDNYIVFGHLVGRG
jgi:sortase (surface protein transpeptidase)